MLLSVIIPAYNAQDCLDRAVRSILAQKGCATEIILIDDGSTDRTGQVADRLARMHPTVRVLHTENRGAACARNLGLDAASGDYVAFLDSDDLWCTDAVDETVAQLLSSGSYDILSFGYICADPMLRFGKLIPEENGLLVNGDPEYNQAASRKSFCSYMFRRSLLEQIRFPEGIRYNEDTTFLFLATRAAGNLYRLDRYLFVYRNNLHSALHASDDWRFILTDEIPAWDWAGDKASREKDRLDCHGMVYSLMWDYVRLSSMWGVDAMVLQKEVQHCAPYQAVLTRFGDFWIRPEGEEIHRRFLQDPQKLCRRYRMLGLFPKTARKLSRRIPLLRRLYFRLKYRTPLTGYVRPV